MFLIFCLFSIVLLQPLFAELAQNNKIQFSPAVCEKKQMQTCIDLPNGFNLNQLLTAASACSYAYSTMLGSSNVETISNSQFKTVYSTAVRKNEALVMDDGQVYALLDIKTKNIYITFRGTWSWWGVEVDLKDKPMTIQGYNSTTWTLYSGPYNALTTRDESGLYPYARLIDKLGKKWKEFKFLSNSNINDYNLIITGHSLGGVFAQMFYLKAKYYCNKTESQKKLVNPKLPPLRDTEFCQLVKKPSFKAITFGATLWFHSTNVSDSEKYEFEKNILNVYNTWDAVPMALGGNKPIEKYHSQWDNLEVLPTSIKEIIYIFNAMYQPFGNFLRLEWCAQDVLNTIRKAELILCDNKQNERYIKLKNELTKQNALNLVEGSKNKQSLANLFDTIKNENEMWFQTTYLLKRHEMVGTYGYMALIKKLKQIGNVCHA